MRCVGLRAVKGKLKGQNMGGKEALFLKCGAAFCVRNLTPCFLKKTMIGGCPFCGLFAF